MTRSFWLVCALATSTATLAAQVPGTPAAPQPAARTGMVVGQVVDGTSGQPVAEAIVSLSRSGESMGRVMADDEGRFFFTQLPQGDFYIEATKEGHIAGRYNQRSPGNQSSPLSLSDGERRTDVVLRVWKYGVIGGTVVDEAGEPVVGVTVRALAKNVVAGRQRFGTLDFNEPALATTDDRGMFRLSRLPPSSYVVVVPSTHATVPAARLENADYALRLDVFSGGVQEIAPLGSPRTQQFGDVALMSANRVFVPPPPTANGGLQVYRTTYYPGAPTVRQATIVTVKSGEERTDLTIALQPVPAVRVSGQLVTPDGSVPPPMMIHLVGAAMTDVATIGLPNGPDDVGLESASALSDGNGRFTFLGVPAGDYVVMHASRFLQRPLREGKPSYWFSQPLTVGREDVTNLAIELRHALIIGGRVETRTTSAQPPKQPPWFGVIFETPFGEPGRMAAELDRESFTFSIAGMAGQYFVRPYDAGGWFVESVTLDGKDITDRLVDLQANTNSIVVTYTDRPSKVSGTVSDASGAASTTATVLAFPTDPRLWTGYGASPRNLKSVITNKAGVYSFDHLPPGEYYLIALEPDDATGWQDPARLEVLAGQASRLTVARADALKTLDLRVKEIR